MKGLNEMAQDKVGWDGVGGASYVEMMGKMVQSHDLGIREERGIEVKKRPPQREG